MYDEKTLQIIECIKSMSAREADILEAFIAGFKAGKQSVIGELGLEKLLSTSIKCSDSQ